MCVVSVFFITVTIDSLVKRRDGALFVSDVLLLGTLKNETYSKLFPYHIKHILKRLI
jgi:hypothetical protein